MFLLGVGLLTLAHLGHVQNVTDLLYWQRLVLSAAVIIGGVATVLAGVKIPGTLWRSISDELAPESADALRPPQEIPL